MAPTAPLQKSGGPAEFQLHSIAARSDPAAPVAGRPGAVSGDVMGNQVVPAWRRFLDQIGANPFENLDRSPGLIQERRHRSSTVVAPRLPHQSQL